MKRLRRISICELSPPLGSLSPVTHHCYYYEYYYRYFLLMINTGVIYDITDTDSDRQPAIITAVERQMGVTP